MSKSLLIRSIIIGFATAVVLYVIFAPQITSADLTNVSSKPSSATIVRNGKLTICKLDKDSYMAVKKVKMLITAYSSTPDQTDDKPYETASGGQVVDGVIANNLLSFGTKVRIPELYGDKVFTVEDRMHKRKGKYMADIWMQSREQATHFGVKIAMIEILDN